MTLVCLVEIQAWSKFDVCSLSITPVSVDCSMQHLMFDILVLVCCFIAIAQLLSTCVNWRKFVS